MKKLIMAAAATTMLVSCGEKELKLQDNNIDKIVAAMTLEEKAALVVGVGMDSGAVVHGAGLAQAQAGLPVVKA